MHPRLWTIMVMVIFATVACNSTASISPTESAESTPPAAAQPGIVTLSWQTEGCPEPAPLIVESSTALETDVDLAAASVAERHGVSLDEAKRRLRLQTVLSERLGQVQVAESGRVAGTELRHEPTFAAVATLTGTDPISPASRALLCDTPELEIRIGAAYTTNELLNELTRLADVLSGFGGELNSYGPREVLEFEVLNDDARDRLDALLAENTDYPYVIESLGIEPLVLDPTVPFPLLDVTGRIVTGAGVSGTLTIEGPCVYLNDVLIILPARETTWDPATGVLNTGSGDMRSGDQVTGGGSVYQRDLQELDQPPDPSCRIGTRVLQVGLGPMDPDATPAPAPPATPRFELTPPDPQPGTTFAAMFDPDNNRGGYFYLQQWNGAGWSAPSYFLESDANREPSTVKIDGEYGGDDYGVSGPGPDMLIMPDDIAPGRWQLCTANAATEICTELTVAG